MVLRTLFISELGILLPLNSCLFTEKCTLVTSQVLMNMSEFFCIGLARRKNDEGFKKVETASNKNGHFLHISL